MKRLSKNELKKIIGGSILPIEEIDNNYPKRCMPPGTPCGIGTEEGKCAIHPTKEFCICMAGSQYWISEECVS